MNTRFSFQFFSGISFALICFFLVTGSLYISILEQRLPTVDVESQMMNTIKPSAIVIATTTPTQLPTTAIVLLDHPTNTDTQTTTPKATSTIIKIYFTTTIFPSETPEPTQSCQVPYGWVLYTIQSGDTLSYLSHITGVSLSQIQSANCLTDSNLIRSGQQIYVPFLPPQATYTQSWEASQTPIWQPTTNPYPYPSETSLIPTPESQFTVTPIYITPAGPTIPVSSPISYPSEISYPLATIETPASSGLP